jgi:hypothetical protein
MITANLIFVDCEARGASPVRGTMTEFGAVHYDSRDTFHGVLHRGHPDPANPAVPIVLEQVSTPAIVAPAFADWLRQCVSNARPVFVSDNPAFDWQWISAMFAVAEIDNPFGHSARRISDFWAGLNLSWADTQSWKRFRVTAHDHDPVHDALGNAEAFARILTFAEQLRQGRA